MSTTQFKIHLTTSFVWFVIFVASGLAWAQPRAGLEVGLSWSRSEGAATCLESQELQAALAAHFGDRVLVLGPGAPSELTLEGHVTRVETRWVVQLTLVHATRGPQGSRTIEVSHPSCREIDEAVVLVLTLMIEPWLSASQRASAEPVPVSHSAGANTVSRSVRSVPPADRPSPAQRTGKRREINLGLGTLLSIGVFPGPAWGVSAAAGWFPQPRFALELGGVWFPAGSEPTELGQLGFRFGSSLLRGCGVVLPGRFRLDGCFGGQLGALHIDSKGFEGHPFARRRLTASLDFVARATVQLAAGVFLRSFFGVSLPLLRDRFLVKVDGTPITLHRLSSVLTSVGFEVGWFSR